MSNGRFTMKYALLIYGSDEAYQKLSEEKSKEMYAQHDAFATKLGSAIQGGAELRPPATATTVRHAGETPLVTDGPFAEAAEQLGGFYLVEAKDLDEAIEFAKQVPTLPGDAIEVRPLAGGG
jgi:hypothetical protein